ncbi:MAG: hypothetical protein GWP12_03210 [Nitrospirae bacterium]|nr:hypothetical protein [Nitrospirota bacterium]
MVVAAPALAGAPVTNPFTTFESEWDYGADDALTEACGFDVYSSGYVSQIEKVRFDREGNYDRFEVHVKGNIDTYAPEFGTSLKSRFALHISERRIEGTEDWSQKWTGTPYNVHKPGSGGGAVIHDRGLTTLLWQGFDPMLNPPISWSGPRDHHAILLQDVDFGQTMCEALAP